MRLDVEQRITTDSNTVALIIRNSIQKQIKERKRKGVIYLCNGVSVDESREFMNAVSTKIMTVVCGWRNSGML
jgi:hypothetical protein